MAEEVIDLYELCAKPLDPWQKFVLRKGLGMTADGRWSALKVACWVPRQNGKGGIIEALELAWLFLPGFQQRLITHSAHLYSTAQEAFIRIRDIIDGSEILRPMARVREANGEQGFITLEGQRLKFVARTKSGTRGFSAPRLVLDEAQEIASDMMAAAMPTMAAQKHPQVWFFGTPPTDPAAWCYALKEDGEAGAPDLCWCDWGDDLDLASATPEEVAARIQDVDRAYAANPAMGDPALGARISEEFVRSEMRPSGLGDRYVFERLGIWRPKATGGAGVIAEAAWARQTQADPQRPTDFVIALDISPSRTNASIVLVGPNPAHEDGLIVSLVDYRDGTDWIVARLAELRDRYKPVAIALDKKGPAGSLLVDLARVGIVEPVDPEHPKRGDLAIPNAADVAAGYGLFVDAVRQGALWHCDDAPLNLALAGAQTRQMLGGGSAWARKGRTDISPLVAATIGNWAYVTRAELVKAAPYDALANIW
ncbi:hypothetical protein ACTOB_001239 [Actinoplanes oblitus]|uniref:Terminase n=1 Tax=Actinoplanes oblitus TaxID=3040509 RepID=A0ABY8WIL1_9ACTN|nr:hypothetical protein [Actinoplanes oblitus]WIM97691.1 hypothetical protein ACTOB_001239 [Actinoplanes oblitus]